MSQSVAVIIPAIHEASAIQSAVDAAWRAGADEVIVADGGSSDRTAELAEQAGAVVTHSQAGRAVQQNAGARCASADILVFQHADCRLGSRSISELRGRFEQQADLTHGGFRQQIDSPRWVYRVVEAGNAVRARYLGLAYGDQAIFVKREIFEAVGGFAEVELMEDVILMQALRRHGWPELLRGPIVVDPRRWQRNGVVRQTLTNWSLLTGYFLGVPPSTLHRFYPRHDHGGAKSS